MSRRLIITIFCFMLGALFAQEARAATRTVDRVDEPQFTESATFCTAAPNDCSLRGAIHGAAHGDVINFDPSLNGQTIISGTESATWANISKNISIVGPGAHLLTISGNNVQQVFHLFSGASVSISGLTIANGKVDFDGAALDADSSTVVSLSYMVFTDNFAAGVELDRGWGGAISNFGAMTINNCAFNGNRANRRGGAIYNGGVLTVDNSSFSGNNSVSGTGGAIYNESLSPHANTGLLTVTNTSFTNNTAGGNGGGIYVFEGAANISNSTFSGNSTNLDGGGIFVNQGISHNFGNLTVNLTNVTFSGNRARLRGGAIFNNFNEPFSGNAVTNLNHVTITNNTANHSGGGVYNHDTRT